MSACFRTFRDITIIKKRSQKAYLLISIKTMTKIDYNKIADNYSRYREIDPAVFKNILNNSRISNDSKVLEVGCGTGNYICKIQDTVSCESYGIDPSKEMLSIAENANKAVKFSNGNSDCIDFDDSFFDLVFSVDLIHHIVNHKEYFREACRILKPGGLLATFTDTEETIKQRMPLAFYFPKTVKYELKRYPPLYKMKELSRHAGFKIISEETIETPYILTSINKYREKAFSCLRIIPEKAFNCGIKKMEEDLQRNEFIKCISRNYVIWNIK